MVASIMAVNIYPCNVDPLTEVDRGILVLLIDTCKPKRNVWNLGCLLFIIHV